MNFEEMKNACIVEVLKDIKAHIAKRHDECEYERDNDIYDGERCFDDGRVYAFKEAIEILDNKIKEHGGEA